jgi:hypothetical protein
MIAGVLAPGMVHALCAELLEHMLTTVSKENVRVLVQFVLTESRTTKASSTTFMIGIDQHCKTRFFCMFI